MSGLFRYFDQFVDSTVERDTHFQQQRTVIANDAVFIVIINDLVTDAGSFAQLIARDVLLRQKFIQTDAYP